MSSYYGDTTGNIGMPRSYEIQASSTDGYVNNDVVTKSSKKFSKKIILGIVGLLTFAAICAIVLGLIPVYLNGKFYKYNFIK